jgi:hypothetical protein
MILRAPTAFQIPNAPGWWQETTARYWYALDGATCPICHGVGVCWRGWFHCDGFCHAIACIADGRVFLPVTRVAERKEF